jgi:hypothetical protein
VPDGMPHRPRCLLQSFEGNPNFKGKPSVCGEFLVHSNPTRTPPREEWEYFIKGNESRANTDGCCPRNRRTRRSAAPRPSILASNLSQTALRPSSDSLERPPPRFLPPRVSHRSPIAGRRMPIPLQEAIISIKLEVCHVLDACTPRFTCLLAKPSLSLSLSVSLSLCLSLSLSLQTIFIIPSSSYRLHHRSPTLSLSLSLFEGVRDRLPDPPLLHSLLPCYPPLDRQHSQRRDYSAERGRRPHHLFAS